MANDRVRQGVKRRFPGPAGLLPLLKSTELVKVVDSTNKSHPLTKQIDSILSQPTIKSFQSSQDDDGSEKSFFEKRTWKELRKALGFDSESDCGNKGGILETMNIQWVQTKAKRFPVSLKVPFLAVVLQDSPELLSDKIGKFKPPCVKLLDPSGAILAALDTNFVTAYASQLHTGTCFALQNVGLLHFKRQLILTITLKNLIFMTSYSNIIIQDHLQQAKHISTERTPATDIQLTRFCEFSHDSIANNFHQLENLKYIALNEEFESNENKKSSSRADFGCGESVSVSASAYFPVVNVNKVTPEAQFSVPDNTHVFDDDDEFFKALGDFDFP